MKKIILKIGILAILTMIIFPVIQISAQTTSYVPLAPLPGTLPVGTGETNLQTYLPGLFNLLIGLAAVAAVLNIVIGGFQYMSSDAIQGKSAGKERIKNAILSLVLIIAAWLILYTINPNLLNLNLNISAVTTTAPAAVGAGGASVSVIDRTNVNLNTTDQLLTENQASATLTGNGFTFSSTGNCTDPTNANCTSVAGMHSDTVAGLDALKTTCGTACGQLAITGGTETGHSCYDPATCLSHQSGFKADVSNTQGNGAAFQNFIGQQVQAQDNVSMTTNGFYNISVGGFNYQVHPEGDHIDITVIPKTS